MKKIITIALLNIVLVGVALAQRETKPKTDGILVEINRERVGDEQSALGNISRGDGNYLMLEVTEVATKKTHVIACRASDSSVNAAIILGKLPHLSRYYMRYTKANYPENTVLDPKLSPGYNFFPLVSGTGVEITGPVQILNEDTDPEKWVAIPGRNWGTKKYFTLKQKQSHQICPSQSNGGHYGGTCRTVVTPEPVPVRELPCDVCVTP